MEFYCEKIKISLFWKRAGGSSLYRIAVCWIGGRSPSDSRVGFVHGLFQGRPSGFSTPLWCGESCGRTGRRKPVGKAVGKSGWFELPAAAVFSFCFFFFCWEVFVYDAELY